MRLRTATFGVALALCSSVVAGCGGTSATPSVPSLAPSGPTPVTLSVSIPDRAGSSALRGRATASTRRASYVSVGTKSAAFSATDASGNAVASTTAGCAATCTATLNVAPGTYTFTIKLYDGSGGTGNLLSTGTATKTIGATAQTVSVTFGGGAVARISLTLEPASVASGTAQTFKLFVNAEDADGDEIVGIDPFASPITLSTSDSTNLQLSVTSVTSPGQSVSVRYSGAALASLVISASASGIPSDYAFLSVDGATPPPQVVTSGNDPVQRYHKPGAPASPGAVPTAPAPLFTPTAAPVGPLAAVGAISTFGSGSAATTFDVLNPGSTRAFIGLASTNNIEGIATAPLSNFQVSVSQSGLQTFSVRRGGGANPNVVINLQSLRTSSHSSAKDIHPRSALEKMHSLGRGVAAARRTLALPAIGATQSFNVGKTQQAFTAKAIAAGGRAVIWTANSLSTDATSDATVAQFVTMAQNSLSATDTLIGSNSWPNNAPGIQTYGTCNPDGTATNGTGPGTVADPGYVNVAIYDATKVDPSDNLGSALGFFDANDLSPLSVLNCNPPATSNQTEIVYIKWTSTSTADFAVMQGTFTHEYGHLVTYVQKSIVRSGQYDLSWLLEGLGTLTEDYTGAVALAQGNLGNPSQPIYDVDNSMKNVSSFLAAPQNYSLTGFAGIENGTYSAGGATNYGLSYLFLKYLTDRYGNAFARELNTTTDRGTTNIANAATRRCQALAVQPCPVTFQQLFTDFVTMLAVSNTGITTDPRYNLQSFSLRQTYTSTLSGSSITLSGPATVGTLLPGQTATVQSMFSNGFAFFSFNNFNPSGSTIRLDDLSGGALGLYGTIGQQ